MNDGLILLTGATGYVGGRLLKALENRGRRVRCLARRTDYLKTRVRSETEVLRGDLLDPGSLKEALRGVETAYYLVHSLSAKGIFEEKERQAAENFAQAALEAGVNRIIYLGGLGRGPDLSPHLASRQEVGRILRESGVPTIEFRASVIIGSGSLSFEMVRNLVEKLPVMITPRWVRTLAQPIAIEDVIQYLVAALDVELDGSRIYEIGGADKVSYGGIMREYARRRGLRRIMIPSPFLTPTLSSAWLALITPLYRKVGRKLIKGVRNETIVLDPSAGEDFDVNPRGIREAIERAMVNEDDEFAHTHWSDALGFRSLKHHWWGDTFGIRLVDTYARQLPYSPEKVFRPIQCIGGKNGWYAHNWLWQIRGHLDRMWGGVGLRRGRRDPCDLRPGDAIDFWRVEIYEPDSLLLLFAEMRLPGRAWLQFEVDPDEEGALLRMTLIYDPVGVWGRIYWYGVYPFHFIVFNGIFKKIIRIIEKQKNSSLVTSN
ncbi:SDR family oxidoreductase [bacterium]|nr:MAG: SDR family oxidoreductase [bacterium]